MAADRGGLSPARIETLCDGLFAIAMTILVLELHAPEAGAGGELAARLVVLLPTRIDRHGKESDAVTRASLRGAATLLPASRLTRP